MYRRAAAVPHKRGAAGDQGKEGSVALPGPIEAWRCRKGNAIKDHYIKEQLLAHE